MLDLPEDWDKIREFLEPKRSPYWMEEPSLTQKVFLKSMHKEALFGGAAGGGKMCDICHITPTPSGFRKLADIHPGDVVFGRDGLPHVVLAESEVEFIEGYELTFDDGSQVRCNDDHLWLTFDAKELAALTRRTPEFRATRQAKRPSRTKNAPVHGSVQTLTIERNRTNNPKKALPAPTGTVRTTKEIVDTLVTKTGRRNHAIPVTAPLDIPERDLPIDPYVLGAWLGDGFSREGAICGEDDEIFKEIEKAGYSISSVKQRDPQKNYKEIWFENLRAHLRENHLLGNKHVPTQYLFSAEHQRLALLQGLLDTDGTVAKTSGSAEFTNTNKNLADAVAFLARSLGMKATIREGRATLNGKDHGPKWTVKFVANQHVFRLPRKRALQKLSQRRTTQYRYIVKAERISAIPMKCIRVSSPDSLYLTTENLIPTHNSSALLMAALQFVDVPNYSAILFRRTYADLDRKSVV